MRPCLLFSLFLLPLSLSLSHSPFQYNITDLYSCDTGYSVKKYEANGRMLALVQSENYPRLTNQPCMIRVWSHYSMVMQSDRDATRGEGGGVITIKSEPVGASELTRSFPISAHRTGIVYPYGVNGVVTITFQPGKRPTRFLIWILDEDHPHIRCPVRSRFTDVYLIRQRGQKMICSQKEMRKERPRDPYMKHDQTRIYQILYNTLYEEIQTDFGEIRYIDESPVHVNSSRFTPRDILPRIVEFETGVRDKDIKSHSALLIKEMLNSGERFHTPSKEQEKSATIWDPATKREIELAPLQNVVITLDAGESVVVAAKFDAISLTKGAETIVERPGGKRIVFGDLNTSPEYLRTQAFVITYESSRAIRQVQSNRMALLTLYGDVYNNTVLDGDVWSRVNTLRVHIKQSIGEKRRRITLPVFAPVLSLLFVICVVCFAFHFRVLEGRAEALPRIVMQIPPDLESAIQRELLKQDGLLPRID